MRMYVYAEKESKVKAAVHPCAAREAVMRSFPLEAAPFLFAVVPLTIQIRASVVDGRL